MDYIEYKFFISPFEQGKDLLLAVLEDLPFESFVEENNFLLAYIPCNLHSEENVKISLLEINKEFNVNYSFKLIPQQNWNAEWESQFDMVSVNDKCIIRAPFHEKQNVPFEIVIEPKMSFGTGHHSTTLLMCQALFEKNLSNKNLLDMGCGTGVLAILASKLGATTVDAIDTEDWSVESTIQNCSLNNVNNVFAIIGDATKIENQYDIILANINKNILKQDAFTYYEHLNANGEILISGFFETDVLELKQHFEKIGYQYLLYKLNKEWAQIIFKK